MSAHRSCMHQHILADDSDLIGTDTPLRYDRRGPRREPETRSVPRAVDELQIAHHHRVTGYGVVHDGATARAAGAQRAALVRTIVRDRIERAVDVVDPDTVAPDRHQLVCARRNLVDRGDNVLTPLRQ